MNYKLMFRMLGRTLQLEGISMCLPLVVALAFHESPLPFLCTMVPAIVVGWLLARMKSTPDFYSREGYVVVGFIWLTFSLVGMVPFVLSGAFASVADCFFEAVSGFTTTGASILNDIESMPQSVLFWRSFSSWLGGMGVLVFTLAFLPKVGVRTQVLAQAESPGPTFSKLVPKTAQSSRILYMMYIGLTLAEILCLTVAGMPLYDAMMTTFGTVCTGGFSNKNLSIAAFGLPACEVIIIVFMFLGSINFAVFFLMLTGRLKQAFRNEEMKFFTGIVVVATLAVFVMVYPNYANPLDGLRDTAFQVVSIISTTGFSTMDYSAWPTFCRFVFILLMIIGGCAGSTAGGIKVARVMVLSRCARRSLQRLSHPRSVKVVSLDGREVSEGTLHTILVFFVLFFMTLSVTILVVSLDGYPMPTTMSAAYACLSNVGPGLDMVGPMGNYAGLSGLSKVVLSISMLIGRLELFPILILLMPSTWTRN